MQRVVKTLINPIEVHWSEVPGVMKNGKKKQLQIPHKNNLIVNLSVNS